MDGGIAGLSGGAGDFADAAADFRRAMRCFMNVAGDLAGSGGLLIDGGAYPGTF